MCWATGTPPSTDVRGLERAWPWSAQGSWWALLLRSRLFGQNVWTPQEAIQPVRHLQGGQDCRCGVVKGMMFVYASLWVPFPTSDGSVCSPLYPSPRLDGAEGWNRWKSSCPSAWRWLWVPSNHFMPNSIIPATRSPPGACNQILFRRARSGHPPHPLPLNGPLLFCNLCCLQVGFLHKVPFGKGFYFPVIASGIDMHTSPERCILPRKEQRVLLSICVWRVLLSVILFGCEFCLKMGWSKSQEWLLANCPSVFLL